MNLFKKAAMLCTALLACLSMGSLSACGLDDLAEQPVDSSASSEITESSSDVSSEDSSDVSSEDSSSEDSSDVSSEDSSSEDSSDVSSEDSSDVSSEDSSSEEEPPITNYAYRISLQNATGNAFSGITVRLFDGDTEIISKKTTTAGYATFRMEDVPIGEYTIVVEPPLGYAFDDADKVYTTLAIPGQEIIIPIHPTGVMAPPEDGVSEMYSLGSVMYDFTVITSDNNTFTLSEVLQEKDMVLLNFWATWCGPCKAEFPAMNSAYVLRQDDVSILAMSTTDGKGDVAAFKAQQGISFDMCHDQAQLTSLFNTSAIPVSVIIDRYGVVAYMHAGSMVSVSEFTDLFDMFIGDDYQPTIINGIHGGGGEGEDVEDEMIIPTVEAPDVNAVKEVLSPDTDFTFEFIPEDMAEDEALYSWPWAIDENNEYLYPTNPPHHNSYAQMFGTFTAQAGDVLCFDYQIGTELNADILYVVIDGVIVQQLSGIKSGWNTCYAYVFENDSQAAGEHEVAFIYRKDGDTSGDDIVYIKNLRFESMLDLDHVDMDLVYRQGGEVANEAGAATQFKNYITPVFNETDGYYHVGTADGPILFANMMNVSAWSQTSVWLLAYYDYVVYDGFNYRNAIEDYAWQGANNMVNYGYAPVTKELRYLLDIVVKSVDVYKQFECEYHENEWLELCAYYAHYGSAEAFEDPMKTITFHAAVELHEGENTVSVPFAMNPRGFKYKFTPDETAIYRFYSTGELDTVCWLVQLDEFGNEIFLGEWDDLVYAETYEDENGTLLADRNFDFHYVLTGGETYYLLCTTFLDVTGSYKVHIENAGDSYTYMANAATGPYSYNEVTGETFIPDAISFAYSDPSEGGDGYYHYLNEDGTLGSTIYLDCLRTTAFFNSNTLYEICLDALNYSPEKRAFYINGHDYTEDLMAYVWASNNASLGDKRGFAAVDQTLFEILYAITTAPQFEGTENSWLMLCYYEKTITIS